RSNVGGIVAKSRPNRGTQMLVEAKPPGLWVVPFIRPYRVESDVQTWSEDPAIFAMIEEEFNRGYYKGIGEFHIYGETAQRPLVRPFPARLRYLDQSALVELRLDHDGLSRLAGAAAGGAGNAHCLWQCRAHLWRQNAGLIRQTIKEPTTKHAHQEGSAATGSE